MIRIFNPSFWTLLSIMIFLVSCNRGNPYRSSADLENYSGTNEDKFLSLGKKVPVLRKLNLQTLTVGKNRIEIEKLMGEPEGKSLDGGNGYLWDYRRPVYDEASDQIYGWSLISFKFISGLCSNVNVRLEHPPIQLTNPEADLKSRAEYPEEPIAN